MMSRLHVDHAIPPKIGDELWPLLTAPERRFLQNLLFRLCERCSIVRARRLTPRGEIERLYVATYYDGSRAEAVADGVRWALLQRVLGKVYEHRKVG
jgi:hypothetical protein